MQIRTVKLNPRLTAPRDITTEEHGNTRMNEAIALFPAITVPHTHNVGVANTQNTNITV